MAHNEDLEVAIRAQYGRGDHSAAIALAIQGYGPELLGFLASMMGSIQDAEEVFAEACSDMWRGAATFRWDCTFRTWSYTIARHAMYRIRKEGRRKAQHHAPDTALVNAVAEVRTRTAPFLRTEVRDRVTKLRSELTEDEQELLVLRVDRQLSWNEIARVMLPTTQVEDAATLLKESARCRKRFERAKNRLRGLAEREGLLDT